MAEDLVLFDMIAPHVALVTLNRPEKRNAVNAAMTEAIHSIVLRTEEDPEVRAVILTSGEDRVFCSGADLASGAEGGGRGLETSFGFAGFCYAQRRTPWIAAVEGIAVAGGFELCLACDMIVASENARFGLPEVKRSLLAGGGSLHRLPNRIPPAIAYEMIATGDPIDAQEAWRHGLVNRLVAPGEALAGARRLAERIVANAPLAVQYALAAAKNSAPLPDAAGRAVGTEWLSLLRQSEDFREGPRAFLEKREPVWTGR